MAEPIFSELVLNTIGEGQQPETTVVEENIELTDEQKYDELVNRFFELADNGMYSQEEVDKVSLFFDKRLTVQEYSSIDLNNTMNYLERLLQRVNKVKETESRLVTNLITVAADDSIADDEDEFI